MRGSRNKPNFLHSLIGQETILASSDHSKRCDEKMDHEYIPEDKQQISGNYSFTNDGAIMYSTENNPYKTLA